MHILILFTNYIISMPLWGWNYSTTDGVFALHASNTG